MIRLLYGIAVFAICQAATAGLIVQPPSGGVVPGETNVFSIAIRNESNTPVVWDDVVSVGPFFFDVTNSVSGGPSPGVPVIAPFSDGLGPAVDWQELAVLPNFGNSVFVAPVDESGVPLSPAVFSTIDINPGDELVVATLSLDLAADFVGSFDINLLQTVGVTDIDERDVTTDPNDPFNLDTRWFDDNPSNGSVTPKMFQPPPGGGSPQFQFTAVPEPSAFLFFGMLGVVSGARRFWRRRNG